MTDSRFGQSGQYLAITTPLGADKLVLRSIRGEESLSSLFRYRVTMVSDDDSIAFDDIVGKAVTVTLTLGDGSGKRHINAIVGSIELTHIDERDSTAHYEADLHPWLWMLTHSGDCRIFQNLSVPDIVERVCRDAGFTAIRKALNGTYAAREYCVQYRETDHNFIARLLEEEGIFYFFEHAEGKHKLVLGDGPHAFAANRLIDRYDYRGHTADDQEDDVLTALSVERRVTTKSVGVDSYNFETPGTDLYATAEGRSGTGMINDYAVAHATSDEGERIAKLRQQALAFAGKRIRGGGVCRALEAGTKITVSGHRNSELNGELVLHSVRIEAAVNRFAATFSAFPAALPFRPTGTAAKPRIHSTQTAVVAGKSGEEIWLDKYGRIKVQFHWDRQGKQDEKSSCWVRVAQNWAGKNYGIMFFPRVGQEVVVTFLDGDPDRPLVTGSVYNAEQTVPYTLPDESTKSTIKTQTSKNGSGKFNEIRFEDKADAEELYVHAQKDMTVEVLNDLSRLIKHDEQETVEHDRTLTVKNNHSVTVSEGNETHAVSKGTRAVSVKGKETHDNDDDFEHHVAKNYTLTVDGDLTIDVTGKIVIKGKSVAMSATSADVALKSATGFAVEAGTALEVKSGTGTTVKAGTSLDLKAAMSASLKADMNVDLKANLALTAEGLKTAIRAQATGEVNSGGLLTVKGGLVKVN